MPVPNLVPSSSSHHFPPPLPPVSIPPRRLPKQGSSRTHLRTPPPLHGVILKQAYPETSSSQHSGRLYNTTKCAPERGHPGPTLGPIPPPHLPRSQATAPSASSSTARSPPSIWTSSTPSPPSTSPPCVLHQPANTLYWIVCIPRLQVFTFVVIKFLGFWEISDKFCYFAKLKIIYI